MKKDWLLLAASIVLTLGVALGIVRWLAPQLLGITPDLQLVKIDKKVPPFFENLFRAENFNSRDILIQDPITSVRAIPLYPDKGAYGPNDLLGFRNRAIPNSANIVVLGDSQTYGNNAVIEQNWPGFMHADLKSEGATLYNMSVGGWAAPQYLDMFRKAAVFKPEIIIVAFYSGNDPLEGFIQVYGNPYWQELISDKTLTAGDAPKEVFSTAEDQRWEVTFKDGVQTVFTPSLRLTSNSDHPAIQAGYGIMAEVARLVAGSAANNEIKVFFTVIPTKELVYAQKVTAEGIPAPQAYQTLIAREQANIEALAKVLRSYPGAVYVDVLQPLQEHAMQAKILYPEDENGHPVSAGYAVIGRTLSKAVKPHLSRPRQELATVEFAPGQYRYILIKDNGVYIFASADVIESNGWPPGTLKVVAKDDIADLPMRGVINDVDPALYGPLGGQIQ